MSLGCRQSDYQILGHVTVADALRDTPRDFKFARRERYIRSFVRAGASVRSRGLGMDNSQRFRSCALYIQRLPGVCQRFEATPPKAGRRVGPRVPGS